MNALDKLGWGMHLFYVMLFVALVCVKPQLYQRYYTDLARRGRIGVMKYLVLAVFLLGAPYLYGELFPLNNGFVAMLLQMAIGTCAAIVLCDVGWFVYSHYGRHDRDQT